VLAAAAPAAASDYPWAPEPAAVPLPASIAVTVAPPAYDWGQPPASIPIIASAPDDSADARQAPPTAGTATYPGADYAWAQPAAGIAP
jgi:hypothetical protein